MVLENVYKFREVVTRYTIERGCELEKITNDKNRVRHNCNKTNTNSMCNTKYLAKYYKSRIISQSCIKGWEMQDLAREDLGLYAGKKFCLKARKQVLKEVMSDHVKEFGRIYDYRDVLLQSNPGNTCVVKVTDSEDGNKLFHSFYIFFAAMKRGFIEGCRKCIGILKSNLEINDEGAEFTIISDMENGLYSAVQKYLPECEHRMCARHILANWQQKWKGIERKNGFWSCARSTYEAKLKANLDKLSKLGHKIYKDLVNYNPEKWNKAMFRTSSKCDNVDNNMAKSFNAWVLGPRHKTIISMLEEIKIKVMNRFTKVRAFADTWNEGISPMEMCWLQMWRSV
ncbi:uncharacterized protein LOC142163284 [Nicotiana tabacum]|uniref:Uncharacterized protein LOC142163284 n=1 Tax=Nicotiana tabacum TaxID=4097 RepID=A0AC58RV97_TOBAC